MPFYQQFSTDRAQALQVEALNGQWPMRSMAAMVESDGFISERAYFGHTDTERGTLILVSFE